jgi:undecaprenyl-diphosphatase
VINVFQAILLGIVQGATEFVPVSSSGHLVIVPWLLRWPEPGVAFDTMLHLGTLLAVVLVFWKELWSLARAGVRSVIARRIETTEARLAWWVLLATIPAALMGIALEHQFEALFSTPPLVAAFLLVTGIWLVLAERLGRRERRAEDLNVWQSLLVGAAQGLAIAPGISRSGATMGTGMLLGLKRDDAARFSFMLSAPIILGAGLMQARKLLSLPDLAAQGLPILFGFLAAFVTGYACIRILLSYLRDHNLYIFAAYCWILGLVTLAVFAL